AARAHAATSTKPAESRAHAPRAPETLTSTRSGEAHAGDEAEASATHRGSDHDARRRLPGERPRGRISATRIGMVAGASAAHESPVEPEREGTLPREQGRRRPAIEAAGIAVKRHDALGIGG